MFHHTESKPQCWRALAVLADQSERLIILGRSTTQVRAGYSAAFLDLLEPDEQEMVEKVSLQRWEGTPDSGRWHQQTTLKVPNMAAQLLKIA